MASNSPGPASLAGLTCAVARFVCSCRVIFHRPTVLNPVRRKVQRHIGSLAGPVHLARVDYLEWVDNLDDCHQAVGRFVIAKTALGRSTAKTKRSSMTNLAMFFVRSSLLVPVWTVMPSLTRTRPNLVESISSPVPAV